MKQFDNPIGATPLDPDEIDGLKLPSISTRAELDRWEQENIQDAMSWIERRHKTDILTEGFMRKLHENMFGKVWDWAGTFRKSDKNIGTSWTAIPIELKILLEDVKFWIANDTYSTDEIGYRFHHKLVWIHLFPNGNGRHARLITDILLQEQLKANPFTWGNGNLLKASDVRQAYINALKAADKFDFALLSQFVRS